MERNIIFLTLQNKELIYSKIHFWSEETRSTHISEVSPRRQLSVCIFSGCNELYCTWDEFLWHWMYVCVRDQGRGLQIQYHDSWIHGCVFSCPAAADSSHLKQRLSGAVLWAVGKVCCCRVYGMLKLYVHACVLYVLNRKLHSNHPEGINLFRLKQRQQGMHRS